MSITEYFPMKKRCTPPHYWPCHSNVQRRNKIGSLRMTPRRLAALNSTSSDIEIEWDCKSPSPTQGSRRKRQKHNDDKRGNDNMSDLISKLDEQAPIFGSPPSLVDIWNKPDQLTTPVLPRKSQSPVVRRKSLRKSSKKKNLQELKRLAKKLGTLEPTLTTVQEDSEENTKVCTTEAPMETTDSVQPEEVLFTWDDDDDMLFDIPEYNEEVELKHQVIRAGEKKNTTDSGQINSSVRLDYVAHHKPQVLPSKSDCQQETAKSDVKHSKLSLGLKRKLDTFTTKASTSTFPQNSTNRSVVNAKSSSRVLQDERAPGQQTCKADSHLPEQTTKDVPKEGSVAGSPEKTQLFSSTQILESKLDSSQHYLSGFDSVIGGENDDDIVTEIWDFCDDTLDDVDDLILSAVNMESVSTEKVTDKLKTTSVSCSRSKMASDLSIIPARNASETVKSMSLNCNGSTTSSSAHVQLSSTVQRDKTLVTSKQTAIPLSKHINGIRSDVTNNQQENTDRHTTKKESSSSDKRKQLSNVSNTHCPEHRSVCTQEQIEQKRKEALEKRRKRIASTKENPRNGAVRHKSVHPNKK